MGNALLLEYLYALVMIGLQADSALGIESYGSLSRIEQDYSRGSRVRLICLHFHFRAGNFVKLHVDFYRLGRQGCACRCQKCHGCGDEWYGSHGTCIMSVIKYCKYPEAGILLVPGLWLRLSKCMKFIL